MYTIGTRGGAGQPVKGAPLKTKDLWSTLRSRAHIVFPLLTLGVALLILTCPLYAPPLTFLCQNAFARFCMFWCLAVFTVLSFANRLIRPSTVAIVATVVAIVVGALFAVVCTQVPTMTFNISDGLLACLSGAILGALAGTWLIYAFEVYARHR